MMGAGAMFGIISILALIIWGLCKIFNKKRVAPENMMTEDP
jgi:Na+-transporting methylmalonyl-CoA/oxaloacetate decarboxylase gamma subunit